jgi:hypothetical protein
MQIMKRTMGWIQKPSAYNYSQQQNAKRKALAQDFMNQQSALSGTLFSVADNASYSMVEQTLKAVAAKVQAAAKARIDAGLAQIDSAQKDILGNKTSASTSGSDVLDKTA